MNQINTIEFESYEIKINLSNLPCKKIDEMEEEDFQLFSKSFSTKPDLANLKVVEEEPKLLGKKFECNENASFADLHLQPWLIDTLEGLSMSKPTRIQQASILPILEGHDFVGSAPTGSGKTAAFALPLVQLLAQNPRSPFCLVVTPTRELAFQIVEQFKVFGRSISIRVTALVGGMDIISQQLELKKRPHILVCTLGRLLDILRSSPDCLSLARLNTLVVDEADRMLEGTLVDELRDLAQLLPSTTQRLLFSATMTAEPERYAFLNLRNPLSFHCNENFDKFHQITAECQQQYLLVPARLKDCYLIYLVSSWYTVEKGYKSLVIFVNRCKETELLYRMLQRMNDAKEHNSITRLHSQMPQKERLESIRKFRNSIARIMVCTDVASRGLDIPQVDVIVNFDLPNCPKDYVHRVGRTGRAGRLGNALSLVTEHDIEIVQHIEQQCQKQLEELDGISEKSVLKLLNKSSEARKVCESFMKSEQWGANRERNKRKKLDQQLE